MRKILAALFAVAMTVVTVVGCDSTPAKTSAKPIGGAMPSSGAAS